MKQGWRLCRRRFLIHHTCSRTGQTLFRATATGVRTSAMGFCSRREIGPHSEYNKEKWGFIVKDLSRGVSGWKITKEA